MKDPVIGNADEVEAVAVDFLASSAKVDELEACGGGLLLKFEVLEVAIIGWVADVLSMAHRAEL